MARGWFLLISFETVALGLFGIVEAQFFNGFYRTKGCTVVEAVVLQAVTKAFNQDPRVALALIRMLFHDCFLEVVMHLFSWTPTPENPKPKKLAAPNLSVRGYEVIDAANTKLERICLLTVSYADIVALTACDAVVLTGGQRFEMPTGRLDSMISSADSANSDLVSTNLSASELTQKFSGQSLGQDKMIMLSGETDLGHSHIHDQNLSR